MDFSHVASYQTSLKYDATKFEKNLIGWFGFKGTFNTIHRAFKVE